MTGVGQQASAKFNLSPGLVIFRLTHDGQAHFAIWLLDDQGRNVDLLVNKVGPFHGSKAVAIQQEGAYLLDVSADGNWDVQVSHPVPTTVLEPPIALTGKGQQASDFFRLQTGLAVFRMTHDGQAHFAIWLLDDQGRNVDLFVNKVGPIDGSKAVGVEKAGEYLLDISADGSWTVDIETPE